MPLDGQYAPTLRASARIAVTLAAVALATWLETLLAGSPMAQLSLMPSALAIALSEWVGGLGTGLLALVASAIAIDFFVIVPGSLFRFTSPAEALVYGAFLAGWLAFCLAAEQLHHRMRRDAVRRAEAERSALEARRRAQLTTALAQARTPASVIEAAIQEPLHALGADAALLLLVGSDGQSTELARAVGYETGGAEARVRAALDGRSPISDAVGRGAPVIVESAAVLAAEYGVGDAGAPFEALVAIPLVIGSRVVAVALFEFRGARTFTSDDREYAFELGPRAAQALDRTWQYEYALRARAEAETLRARGDQELEERQNVELALRSSEARYRALAARTSRLHALTAALSEAVMLKEVAQAVVHQGRIAVGATTGEVTLLVEDAAAFETLYSDAEGRAGDQASRFPLDSGLCATQAVQTGRPVFVASFPEWQERYWRSASIAADGGYVSGATLPLLVKGAPIGVLAFHFTAPVNFDDDYQALLVSVAQHCAQALDRARLYESAQQARDEAETANRLKDEFVSIVSHELRTPLNAMLGWTSMLQKGSMDSAKAARALNSIHDNATRQARLIDELLDFSRIVSGRMALDAEHIDIRDLLRGVVESMIPAASANGQNLVLAPVPLVWVTGDLRRLEQVFFNLLGNAVKFTPRGGRIAIDVEVRDGAVRVIVSDNGLGIEPQFLAHVFDRFRQADSTTARTFGGLGLGLSIARQLVDAHKGTIAVESEGKGRGSTFIVTLPLSAHQPEQPAAPSADALAAGPHLDGIRVLVVDDEADTRDIIVRALEGCGALVTTAGTAHEALGILEQDEMDVLLADIALPEEDGYALIQRVRASAAGRIASIPAAAVTAHVLDEERRRAIAAGFHLHLAKPFEPVQLARTVESLVRGSSAVH
ncbi:MAG TPA: ATP-binding protein [Vicinamibacterales bacterium]|nr:ATP-binding protein [Vicinamibacterales bacterium]